MLLYLALESVVENAWVKTCMCLNTASNALGVACLWCIYCGADACVTNGNLPEPCEKHQLWVIRVYGMCCILFIRVPKRILRHLCCIKYKYPLLLGYLQTGEDAFDARDNDRMTDCIHVRVDVCSELDRSANCKKYFAYCVLHGLKAPMCACAILHI